MSAAVASPLLVPSGKTQDSANANADVETTSQDFMFRRLRQEALETLQEEPELSNLLHQTVLAPGVETFEDAVAATVCYRLLLSNNSQDLTCNIFCANTLLQMLKGALDCEDEECLELGHTMSQAVRLDALAVLERDPACDTLLEVILFYKGFAALVCHRAARQKWIQSLKQQQNKKQPRRSMTALFLQSQASAVFGVDIHPAATMGAGILLDHGTGIVIGETARVGNGCTMLHGVTLGGTGKEHGDRHPKVGHHVLIGAGASVLGNIKIGNAAKIGAGSIVLRDIPAGATAVGAPAKIIGHALEANPASTMDEGLDQVGLLHKSMSSATMTSSTVSLSSSNNSVGEDSRRIEREVEEEDITDDENNDSEKRAQEVKSSPPPSETTEKSGVSDKQQKSTTFKDPDDNSTSESSLDSGTKAEIKEVSEPLPPGCVCPFRDYNILAQNAPKGTVTICTLHAALAQSKLKQKHLSKFEIQSAFFHLDVKNVGFVSWSHLTQHLAEALRRAAPETWSDEEIDEVVQNIKDLPPSKRPVVKGYSKRAKGK